MEYSGKNQASVPEKNRTGKKTSLARAGEAFALSYLKKSGLVILESNYRIRGGEIDLIAEDGGTTVFVEVKSRSNQAFGRAIESITPEKMERIYRTAEEYLRKKDMTGVSTRFDLFLLEYCVETGKWRMEWIKGV